MRATEAGRRPSINPRIAQILLPLTAEARRELETSILAEGVRDPIVVWQETGDLLDGRTRLEIVHEHSLPFPDVRELSFGDEEAAKAWVLSNQLGRRNLTPKESALLRGRLVEMRKRNDRANLLRGKQESPGPQNEAPGIQPRKTADVIAANAGVSGATVERDARFARSVDQLATAGGQEVANEAIRGPLRQHEVIAFAKADGPKSLADLRAFSRQIENERKPRPTRKDDQRPFFTRAAKAETLQTYIDAEDGLTYARRVRLTCGHWHVFKRRRPAHSGKSYPCEKCGSGTRRPHERRLTRSQLQRQVTSAVLDPARLDDLIGLVEKALQLASIHQPDARGQQLVEDLMRHALKAGLLDRERAGSRRHASEEE